MTVINQIGLNGSVFSQQPTEHSWVPKDPIGIDGNGIEVMPAVREYQLKWDFVTTDVWNEIYAAFTAQGVTGSVVASLPKWSTSPYQMYAYSGCVVREMVYDSWFENYYSNVRLLIVKIVT